MKKKKEVEGNRAFCVCGFTEIKKKMKVMKRPIKD